MKTLLSVLILTLWVSATFAQKPDSWKGLIIDQSSPEQAIETLGKPDADKTDSFRVYKIDDWLTKDIRVKQYRRLEYEKIEGFKKVILAFKEGKLVFIELNPQKLDPDVLEGAYGVEFTPTFNKFSRAMEPGRYERDAGKVKAKSYPSIYYLYAKAEKTFLLAEIANSSLGSLLGSKSVNDDIGFPGKVVILQIVSRTLENKDNTDILK